jgi:hypothetical protein
MTIPWFRFIRTYGLLLGIVVLTGGCFSPKPPSAENSADGGGVTASEATPRQTLNKTTQNVLKLDDALATGGVRDGGQVSSTNPLMQTADVYRTQVAKVGGMAVQQAIQLRNAQSIQDPKPLTHAQFMAEIIKPNQPDGIQLPMLPYYQEYAWDESAQALVVVNFPARIDEREKRR